MLNRLMLLTAGNEPKLAELFARAELRRGELRRRRRVAVSADWVTGAKIPGCAARSNRRSPPRRWFSCNFFACAGIILTQCGRD